MNLRYSWLADTEEPEEEVFAWQLDKAEIEVGDQKEQGNVGVKRDAAIGHEVFDSGLAETEDEELEKVDAIANFTAEDEPGMREPCEITSEAEDREVGGDES